MTARASIGLVLLLGALSAIPPVTTDIYLPALPELTRALHATMGQGQVTLAAYFSGLGAGQLFYGPWSDRIGRRPTMLTGALVYLVASIACAIATSIGQMIAWRFLQAIGACSGVVIATAVVRDRFDRQESARMYSMILTLRSAGPLIAPLIGGAIVTWVGWRAIFWVITAFGASLAAAVYFGLEESRTQAVAVRARSESPVAAYLGALGNRSVLGYLVTSGLNFSCIFIWIAVAPYLIINVYGVPPLYFGWIFGINAAGLMIAPQVNRRLLRSYSSDRILPWGALAAVAAAGLLLLDTLTGLGGRLGLLLPLFMVISTVGFVSTNAMAGGLAADPSRAGTVSALFGASQFAVAGFMTSLAAALGHPALTLAVMILLCALGAAAYPLRLMRAARSAQIG